MLNIKNPEAHRLAHLLAEATHQSLTEAVTEALREKLARVQNKEETDKQEMRREIDSLIGEIAKLPVRDNRTPDEIIGYDEHGLPT